MDALGLLAVFAAIVAILGALDIAALKWGADTRPKIGDDRRRAASDF